VEKYGPVPVLVHDHSYVATEVDTAHVSVDHFGAEVGNSELEEVELESGNY